MTLTVSITDVRNKVGLADYTGEVEVTSTVRITDRLSGTAENQPATVQDTPFGVTVPCVATGSTAIGGTCSISTTLDAVMPGVDPRDEAVDLGAGPGHGERRRRGR